MTIAQALELDRFRAWVGRTLGLALESARATDLLQLLDERRAALGLSAVSEYVARLETGAAPKSESRVLAANLTVGETYFFRHADQFDAFESVMLPNVMRRRAEARELRILSAGCASGEELYSLAFIARRNIAAHEGWQAHLTGIDLNPAVIEKARRATYTQWSLRETPESIKEVIFKRSGRDFVLGAELKQAATFEEKNLLDDDPVFWQPGRFDAIFCRNVLMYFSRETMRQVVARMARSIAPEGYLVLGPSETLRGLSHEFHLRHADGCFYYQRRSDGGSASRDVLTDAPEPSHAAPIGPGPDLADTAWVTSIAEAAARIEGLAARSKAQRERDESGGESQEAAPALETARELFRLEKYDAALSTLKGSAGKAKENADALLLEAVVLINRGQNTEAKDACSRLIRLDELNAGAHYLMALAHEHAGDPGLAKEENQTAIYLDAGFAMPHLHLGILARKAGERDVGRLELETALRLLESEEQSRILLFGGGFSREALIQVCRAELRATASSRGRQ